MLLGALLIGQQLVAQDVLWGLTRISGPQGGGTVFSVTSAATNFTVRKAFVNPGNGPAAGAVLGKDGALYGITQGSSTDPYAYTFYKVNRDGTNFKVLRRLGGSGLGDGGLTQGIDGAFYAVSQYSNQIFKMNADGSGYTVIKTFSNQSGPYYPVGSLTQNSSGAFFGVTRTSSTGAGAIYRINPDGTGYSVLRTLDGTQGGAPVGALLLGRDGVLYGTTSDGGGIGFTGTVFRINQDGTGFRVLHRFNGADGAGPQNRLTQGTDGVLYGTTYGIYTYRGLDNTGSIFKINTDGTGFTLLRSMKGPDGILPDSPLLQGADGAFYGTTSMAGDLGEGTLFRITANGADFRVLKHFAGQTPAKQLARGADGTLYGAASNYQDQTGILFSIKPDGTAYTTVATFGGDRNGMDARGTMVQASDGAFYGTAYRGGNANHGVLFKLNADGTGYSVVKHFSGTGGSGPVGKLIQGRDGALYGVTLSGGTYNGGTVFKILTNGTGFAVVRHLAQADGQRPQEGVMQGLDGALYGTTSEGGVNTNGGTVFRVSTSGTGFTVLKSFNIGSEGAAPYGGLVQGTDGTLYGTTSRGGIEDNNVGGNGTIFKINTNGTGFAVLKRLTRSEGTEPKGTLIRATDGALYGTAKYGGLDQRGTIFKINTNGTGFRVIFGFTNDYHGNNPVGALVQGSGGVLYGMTENAGPSGWGGMFRVLPTGMDFTTIRTFEQGTDGAKPMGGLILQKSVPSTTYAFYRAINLNGNAVTLDGKAWAGKTALNYNHNGGTFTNTTTALVPATDATRTAMIRSSIWRSSGLQLNLTSVPSGTYQVYLYVWEDNNPTTFSITLEGRVVQSNYYSGSAGTWKKFGPYQATVTDGTINLATTGGAANFSGVEVWKANTTARVAADDSGMEAKETLRAYPNPADNRFTVELPFAAGEVTGTGVLDATGKQYLQNTHRVSGDQHLDLEVGSLRPGMYLLRVEAGNNTRVLKFIKR
jgi:uncharacterized repeat protein (TIGR03803 family)